MVLSSVISLPHVEKTGAKIGMSLLIDLHAFFTEHREGATDLAGGMLDDQADDSAYVVRLADGTCGVRVVKEV